MQIPNNKISELQKGMIVMYYYKLKSIKDCKKTLMNAQCSKRGQRRKEVCQNRIRYFEAEYQRLRIEVIPFVREVERVYGRTYVKFIEGYFFENSSANSLALKCYPNKPDSIRRDIERFSRKM